MYKKRRLIRDIIFKTANYFGEATSSFLIRFGYLILNSRYFKDCSVPYFKNDHQLFDYILDKDKVHNKDICYLEFGVASGKSLRWWVNNNYGTGSKFVGFDTFYGLPEDWNSFKKGTFSTNGRPPDINDTRISYEIGLFQETLIPFIKNNQSVLSKSKIIHLDADLYSATLFVLINLDPYLKKGDIIIFDDFFSVRSSNMVFKAFIDFNEYAKFSYYHLAKTHKKLSISIT